jgi:Cys-tRNA(Pro) deacylase
MAGKEEVPITPGVRFLKGAKIPFTPHSYIYEEHGGTRQAASVLRVAEHQVIKTLVFETDSRQPLLVLMHGDREVSTKQLARLLGVKRVQPCSQASAQKHTGYQVGGISPFGTKRPLPVYVEKTILSLARIFINGGKRGFLIEMLPGDLERGLQVKEVEVAL